MAAKHAGRRTRRSRKNAADLRAARLPCWLCGQPIDYTAHHLDDNAFSVDHVKVLSQHPELAEDPSNLRAAHRRCNTGRGVSDPRPGLGQRSTQW